MQYLMPLYSKNRSEAEIQADIYQEIKLLGLEPKLEVRGYIDEHSRGRKCIFDVVVFWPLNHKPICIIECKKGVHIDKNSKQFKRYSQFPFPLLYCFKNNQVEIIKQTIDIIKNEYKNCPPSLKNTILEKLNSYK